MRDRAFLISLIVALLSHALLLWQWRVDQTRPLPAVSESREIRFTLAQNPPPVKTRPPEPVPDAVELERESVNKSSNVSADTPTYVPPSNAPVPASRPRLNLQRPNDLDPSRPPPPGTSVVEAFRPQFHERLETRQQTKQRQQFLADRHRQRYGLTAEEDYALEGPTSNHVKTAAGCFSKMPVIAGRQIGLNGKQTRFWQTDCKDLLDSNSSAIEFDGLGRVVPP